MAKDKMELLKDISLFSTLDNQELTIVAQNSAFYTYKKGDVIFTEGNYGDGLYIIDEGEVLITKQRGSEIINIANFIQGESFGELDLLENRPMIAAAMAECDSTLLIFPKKGICFEDVLEKHPVISARILNELLAIIAGRIRNTNRLLSEQSQWIQDLKSQLYSDKLTGLYNRIYLDEEFPEHLHELGEKVSLVMIKPDNFKRINDNYGHEGGDYVLQLLASGINSHLRKDDVAVRYRGDEFAVILPHSNVEAALNFSDGIKSLVKDLNFEQITKGTPLTITASIGVATYPVHAADAGKLVENCFDRMFEAWESGGDCVFVCK